MRSVVTVCFKHRKGCEDVPLFVGTPTEYRVWKSVNFPLFKKYGLEYVMKTKTFEDGRIERKRASVT